MTDRRKQDRRQTLSVGRCLGCGDLPGEKQQGGPGGIGGDDVIYEN